MNKLTNAPEIRTYRLQAVVFFSFLTLFVLIVSGVIIYGYHSNSKIMLQSSDELLYQISETIVRQTSYHLEPAQKISQFLKSIIEREKSSESSPELIENLSLEALNTYPQFSAIYLGDENGNFLITRSHNDIYSTRIVSRTGDPSGTVEIDRNQNWDIIASRSSQIMNYDPREHPWYVMAKASGHTIWSSEYQLFTDQIQGITCANPVYASNKEFVGVIGIDFRMGELSHFLKKLRIGNSGIAFLADRAGNVLAYPETSGIGIDKLRTPRSPMQADFKSGWIKTALEKYISSEERKTQKEFRLTFSHAGTRFITSFRAFPDDFGKDWILGIVVPEDDFIGPVARIHETTLLFSFWLLIIGGFLTSAIARELTYPIKCLTLEAKKIQKFDFEGKIGIRSPISEIQAMGETMDSMKKALNSFSKYVPIEIVQRLVDGDNEARLQAQAEKITIMFTDITGFSSIAERVIPSDLMEQLSEYFDTIAAIIHKNNGTIDKYIGDSIMAFWGAPAGNPDQARQACFAALEIISATNILNEKWEKQNRETFITKIGINTGNSLIGNFGSSSRLNYTAIGDNVNLASRLEGLNKIYNSSIITSESTTNEAGKDFFFRPLDLVAVKGRKSSVKIFQLLGTATAPEAEYYKQLTNISDAALKLYLNKEWQHSYEKFQELLEITHEDIVVEMYLDRCRELYNNPPNSDWDGVFRLDRK